MHRWTPVLFALCSLAAPAKTPWVKQAQELGFKEIENCQSCHEAKLPALNHLGKWLMTEKANRKAKDVDLNWLKEYKKPA